jgi:hypothetical protein
MPKLHQSALESKNGVLFILKRLGYPEKSVKNISKVEINQ